MLLNSFLTMYEEEESPQTVIVLDQDFKSIPLTSMFTQQTKLHMNWVKTMESFYDTRCNSILIPLEYCVRKIKTKLTLTPKQHNFRNVFIYLFGEDLLQSTCNNDNFRSRLYERDITPPTPPTNTNCEMVRKKVKPNPEEELPKIQVELRNNIDFMMKLVKENGMYLYYAHPDLLRDQQLLFAAIKNQAEAYTFVPHLMKKDEQFLKTCLEVNGDVFMYLPSSLRGRKDLFDIASRTSGKPYTIVDDSFREGKLLAFSAVSKYWKAINFVDKNSDYYLQLIEIVLSSNTTDSELAQSNLISDRETVLKLLDISYKAFIMATETSSVDEEIIKKAISMNLNVVEYFTTRHFEFIEKNHELVGKLIQNPNIHMLNFANSIITNSTPENIRNYVIRYPEIANHIPTQSAKDPFILRYLPVNKQLSIIEDITRGSIYQEDEENYEKMGIYFSTELKSGLEKLKERFSFSYPGLVIPFHRFTDQHY